MDLGAYDDANLHDRLVEYHLNRPPIVIQQIPGETLERKLDMQSLAQRAFKRLFTPAKIISEIKERRHRTESYSGELYNALIIDDFIFDDNNELIAGLRFRTIAKGRMVVERIVYRSLEGLGVVLLYKNDIVNLEWDVPKKVTGVQIDGNGQQVDNLMRMLKRYREKEKSVEPEIILI